MRTIRNISFAVVMLSLVACGGDSASKDKAEKDSKANTEKTTTEETEVIAEPIKEEVEIHLIAKGETMAEIAFDPTNLEVPAGSHVKMVFRNESSAAGMLHNFVLVVSGSGQDIATAGIQAGPDSEYVPLDDDRVIAYTKVLDMGEEIVFEFEAPTEKGTYHYICTYPGHYPLMVGRLNVI